MELNDWINVKNKVYNTKKQKLKKEFLAFFTGCLLGLFLILSTAIIKDHKLLYDFHFNYKNNIQHIVDSYKQNKLNFYDVELFNSLLSCKTKSIIPKISCSYIFILHNKKIDDIAWITFLVLENYYVNNRLYEKEQELIEYYLDYQYIQNVFCQRISIKNNIMMYISCQERKEFLKDIEDLVIGNNKNA